MTHSADDALNPWVCRCGTLNGHNDTCYNCEAPALPVDSVAELPFLEACRVIMAHGYQPVASKGYQRLRAWCDLNGWPPTDWQPPERLDDCDIANCDHRRSNRGYNMRNDGAEA